MEDLKKIKKYYGEAMMHLCRKLFPVILEQENLLFNLLESNFAHSKFLANDIINNNLEASFKQYIFQLIENKQTLVETNKTPQELMDEVGYDLYECRTEEEVQTFKKYYAPHEELCTFKGGRLNECFVFFAVSKNVDEIKRKNFKNPKRQDEYGISVISIQFSKDSSNTLSIKNRYNHTVPDPDATFSNNLENIIPGLTRSFEKKYNLNINQNNNTVFELPGYVKAGDGRLYKYNYEIENVYYCPNNVIIDYFEVEEEYLEKEKYLVVDYFIIDLVNKKIICYDESLDDNFPKSLQNINKIEVVKQKDNKLITITLNNNQTAYIEVDKYNRIISYKNDYLFKIEDDFLEYVENLLELDLLNVKIIGNNFCWYAKNLKKVNLPNVSKIGDNCFFYAAELEEIKLNNLEEVGVSFCLANKKILKLDAPNLEVIKDNFFKTNKIMESINIPNVKIIGDRFLEHNEKMTSIYLPNIANIGYYFMRKNPNINNYEINTRTKRK